MVRDDLYVTVPTLFRCPISLDVMKSPVSLSTGVTYDRSSIQRWLDNGNNTCPATMQILDNKDLVPNYTLQRLIQIWSDSTPQRFESDSPKSQLDHEQARRLVDQIKYAGGCSAADVTKLLSFAIASDENRKLLASIDGFVDLLVKILVSGRNLQFAEKVVQLCGVILIENQDAIRSAKLHVMNKDRMDFMIQLLQRGCLDSRIATVRVVELIAGDMTTKVYIAEQSDILTELLRQISIESDVNAIEAYLSCLICLSLPKRIRLKIVRLGAVKVIVKMLSESNTSVAAVVEKELKLLEMVSTCNEGRFEICENDGGEGVKAIVNKVLKVSGVATELAVTILWSLCCLFRDERAEEAVVKSNGLGKILVLIQSNCSPAVRQMGGDLLKIFKVNSKSSISSYETKTTHIMPF